MTVSMAGFAVEDLFVKSASAHLPPGQIILTMGLLGMAFFASLSWQRGEPALPRAFLGRAMLVRCGFEVSGRLFYALALALTPLSTASAILQATPLVVIGGAAILFHERVGWRRWLAVLVGLAGVLVVLRPGVQGFSALSLLAVAGMLGFAGRDLATRAAPKGMSNRQLGTLGFAMLAVAGVVVLGFSGGARVPSLEGAALVLGATVFGVFGYHMLTGAMRTGSVGAVTPFRYTRLVFALILAAAVLGERPDAWTIGGAAVIVLAGIYGLTRRG